MMEAGQIQHPPDGQQGGSKPEAERV